MSEIDEAGQRDGRQASRATAQEIVDDLTVRLAGEDPQVIRDALERGLAAAALPTHAEKWLGDAAIEIAADRRLVVDGRDGVHEDDDQRRQAH